jgi:putative hydrolase of the HAD superfamily
MQEKITHLFCDLGGVLLSNGWDRFARAKAIELFHLEEQEVQERHKLYFHTYEIGKLTSDEYLNNVVFFKERTFSKESFLNFMCAQTTAHTEMIALVRSLKSMYNLTMATINNEGRELNQFRIHHFGLKDIFHFFISSSIVHLSKPDPEIFTLALDIAQVNPSNALYIDDRIQFVNIAKSFGFHGIHHTDYKTTVKAFDSLGLVL